MLSVIFFKLELNSCEIAFVPKGVYVRECMLTISLSLSIEKRINTTTIVRTESLSHFICLLFHKDDSCVISHFLMVIARYVSLKKSE